MKRVGGGQMPRPGGGGGNRGKGKGAGRAGDGPYKPPYGAPGRTGGAGGSQPPPKPRYAFAMPAYTQFPNDILDTLMAELSGAEFKVMAYVARRTFGFRREASKISFNQLCHGLVTAAGVRLDSGTGLSRSTAQEAVNSLEAQGLLVVRRNVGVRGSLLSNTYTLLVEDAASPAGYVAADEIEELSESNPEPEEIGELQLFQSFPHPMPKIGIGGPGGYTENRHSPMPEIGIAYKEEKERGKKVSIDVETHPVEKRAEPAHTHAPGPTHTACPDCEGYGVISTLDYWERPWRRFTHGGTLEGVVKALNESWVKLCPCDVGKSWGDLIRGEVIKGSVRERLRVAQVRAQVSEK